MVCFGHSRYPRAVEGLVLIDPWGFMHPDPLKAKTRPLWAKAAGRAVSRMNIISLLQHSGPLGVRLSPCAFCSAPLHRTRRLPERLPHSIAFFARFVGGACVSDWMSRALTPCLSTSTITMCTARYVQPLRHPFSSCAHGAFTTPARTLHDALGTGDYWCPRVQIAASAVCLCKTATDRSRPCASTSPSHPLRLRRQIMAFVAERL
jgi:hypothetical protein